MSPITIQLDHTATYTPGAPISGKVLWQNLDPESASLEIRLLWFTRGKGDRDFQVLDQRTVAAPRRAGEFPFEFQAPGYPPSFSGKLVSLIWAIEVIQFPEREAELLEIVISPTGQPLFTQAVDTGPRQDESPAP